jgi:hypothetical protein
VSYGIILAFLCTALHIVVDHGVGGQTSFALLPHPSASPAHSDDATPGTPHHEQEDGPWHGQHPTDHQTETHSHFTGYPAVPVQLALHVVPSALATTAGGSTSSMLGAPALCGSSAAVSPHEVVPFTFAVVSY